MEPDKSPLPPKSRGAPGSGSGNWVKKLHHAKYQAADSRSSRSRCGAGGADAWRLKQRFLCRHGVFMTRWSLHVGWSRCSVRVSQLLSLMLSEIPCVVHTSQLTCP